MARLFKTIEEIKQYCPMIGSSEFANFAPFIDQAERDFIVPYIGKELYDDLVEAYNADEEGSGDNLTEDEQALLEKIQAALAFYMVYLWIPSGQLVFGDNGIRVQHTDTLKPAFAWQIKELRKEVIRQAGSAMDALLEFLEENKGDYELWTESTAYTNFKDVFISSSKEFTKYFSQLGNSRLNFFTILPTMKRTEEFTIHDELGKEFYEELKEQFIDDDLTTENNLVVELLKKAIAPLTMVRALTDLEATIDERGVLMFSYIGFGDVESKQPADKSIISKIQNQCREDGKAYLLKVKKFLKDNIEDYPTYEESDAYNDGTTDNTYTNSADDNIYFAG